jgi:hypothetical protein
LTVTVGPDVRHVWVAMEPKPQLLNAEISHWTRAANVAPSTIPGYWMSKENEDTVPGTKMPPRPGQKVVYSLHGGAYIQLSASPHDIPANIGRGLLEHCADVHSVFAVEYRLSKHTPDEPAHPFPAALPWDAPPILIRRGAPGVTLDSELGAHPKECAHWRVLPVAAASIWRRYPIL